MAKRAIPYIRQQVAVLSIRFKEPNNNYCKQWVRMINILTVKRKKYLNLSADDLKVVKYLVGKRFTFHTDFKSHTGANMTMGQVPI